MHPGLLSSILFYKALMLAPIEEKGLPKKQDVSFNLLSREQQCQKKISSPLEGAPLVGAVEYAKFQGSLQISKLSSNPVSCVTSVINSKINVQRKVNNHFLSHWPETIYTN